VTFSGVATLLLLLHLVAFGLYGLSVLAYELGNRLSRQRLSLTNFVSWSAVGLQLVPGILLWYASLAHGGPTFTAYGDLAAKFYALVSPFTFGYEPTVFDLLMASIACLLLITAIATRSLKLIPEMRLPLAVIIITAVIMPNWASGSWAADIRLPVALPFVVIESTRLEVPRRGVVASVAAAALLILALRLWAVSQAWSDYDRLFIEFRTASAVIAPGARLLVVVAPIPEQKRELPGLPTDFATRQSAPFMHMAALAVIDRSAFLPYLFTGWCPIDATPRNKAIARAVAVPVRPGELIKSADPEQAGTLDTGPNFLGERPYWRDWPETFDFVLWIDFGGARKPKLKQLLPLVSGSFFDIYRVIRH
jgi:hypothetical protein